MTLRRIDQNHLKTWTPDSPPQKAIRQFAQLSEGRYQWNLIPPGIAFTIDRLRRERHELIGELAVQCEMDGARVTPKGSLMTADFNLSSAQARVTRAKLLAERVKGDSKIDWQMYLEEFIELVFEAERTGRPDVDLHDVPDPMPDEAFTVEGITLLKQHPAMIFGDGGSFKSFIALYLAGRLAQNGVKVLYADWELNGPDHKQRLKSVFGPNFPHLRYLRCERALVHEADRMRQVVREAPIDYLVCDSVGYACQGSPEDAENANNYFRAVRQIGLGSLHVAHVTKNTETNEHKPFGSVFWHNSARATYYVKSTEHSGATHHVGFYPKKTNLSARGQAVGFTIQFESPERTRITTIDPQTIPDLAVKLSLTSRLHHAVRKGPQLQSYLADLLESKEDSIRRITERYPERFNRTRGVDGAWRISLRADDTECP